MDPRDLLFRLAHFQSLGRSSLRRLFVFFLKEEMKPEQLTPDIVSHLLNLPLQKAMSITDEWRRFNMKLFFDKYRQDQIQFLTYLDEAFPPLLNAIPDPPLSLFLMGQPSLLRYPLSLSVVGTRQPTPEGLRAMKIILEPLVGQKWMLVSGLAKGVDGYAHQLALNSYTIAVLGSGFYHLYPHEHRSLFQKVVDHHLALSEYPPITKPERWQFPERNRLISGLTPATFVVEAKQRSGSLITADQALEQGRDVFALPGTILNPNSFGTNHLIQQGATLVMSSEDLLSSISHTISPDSSDEKHSIYSKNSND